ncbi:hypothetical protein ACTMTI_17880 [Nonomuraea sp. H19]|uniref:hypothetical protein n=1 Tax=Nonomuraea sp. H19 TaxID=3452206 RepID=UPI003F8BCABD
MSTILTRHPSFARGSFILCSLPLHQRKKISDRLRERVLVTERAANPAPAGLIALTCSEIHHLFNHLIAQPVRDLWYRIRWSTWRRQHQHRARTCHDQRRTPTAEP